MHGRHVLLQYIIPSIVQVTRTKPAKLATEGRHKIFAFINQLIRVSVVPLDELTEEVAVPLVGTWDGRHVEAEEQLEFGADRSAVGICYSGGLPIVSSDIESECVDPFRRRECDIYRVTDGSGEYEYVCIEEEVF